MKTPGKLALAHPLLNDTTPNNFPLIVNEAPPSPSHAPLPPVSIKYNISRTQLDSIIVRGRLIELTLLIAGTKLERRPDQWIIHCTADVVPQHWQFYSIETECSRTLIAFSGKTPADSNSKYVIVVHTTQTIQKLTIPSRFQTFQMAKHHFV